MSSGLYSTEKREFDTTLDLTKLRPYGDTMNDGKVQMSFTLPVACNEKEMCIRDSIYKMHYLIL